ncbi:DUF3888 domain-containing protein [Paludicola sp. MB14-C6]|uniref:DUF3888 domain-containing protein n=1 Tax=Paludihabitans sp. MB14-C6 TaxID=3070656 RepID=UPI0027DC3D0D|nr:DUF3888 domain-containing protein [Paludicola sp. MB14-C6]WMJ22803.1 DUF3888 domain-containing protein [Paludicola sp. MB14-C6]
MNKVIKMSCKNNVIYIALLILGLFVGLLCYSQNNTNNFKVTQNTYKTESDCNTVIVKTYLKAIQNASNDFYSDYFTITPTVDFHRITVKQILSQHTTSIIVFTSEPFIGPHDTVGIDEISFYAYETGEVKLKEFKHIVSYSVPQNLKDIVKKPIPGDYE